MSDLGTLGELPPDYVAALRAANLVPLWPSLRSLLPPEAPRSATRPSHWAWGAIRPLLLRAGSLTPIEKAERRVLVLANPGRGLDNLQASAALYLGMQLVLPGEVAPNHRHTPNAARVAVEGQGALTVVGGESCPMEPGDLVLTPSGLWHEHRHGGEGPFMWLDVLDLPLMVYLDVSYVVQGEPQRERPRAAGHAIGGLSPRVYGERTRQRYPILRYPWARTREALEALASGAGPLAEVAYVNPETGADALETIAFTAWRLAPGAQVRLVPISAARVFHVVAGRGSAEIDGVAMTLAQGDTFCVPGRGRISLQADASREPLWLIGADESPVHRKLGVFESGERSALAAGEAPGQDGVPR